MGQEHKTCRQDEADTTIGAPFAGSGYVSASFVVGVEREDIRFRTCVEREKK